MRRSRQHHLLCAGTESLPLHLHLLPSSQDIKRQTLREMGKRCLSQLCNSSWCLDAHYIRQDKVAEGF